MRAALALASLIAVVQAPAPFAEGTGVARPRLALSVSPAQVAVAIPASRRLTVRNSGADRVVVDVTRRAAGRQAEAKTWLRIAPARLSLRSGESATLILRARRPRSAEPGDHRVLVLLTTRPLRGGRVNVQARLGIRVKLHVPGRVVRRLALGRLRLRRRHTTRHMFVLVSNRGNVTVQLRRHVTALLFRHNRRVARLRLRVPRVLRPGARTEVALRYKGRLRGPVTAVVRIGLGGGGPLAERRYHLRL